jgi:hypothetical protein
VTPTASAWPDNADGLTEENMPDDNGGNTGASTAAGGTSTTGTGNAAGDGTGQQAQAAYTPPQTQADLDRIIGDRLARERGRFADYDELKAKAAEHDKAVEANQSEADKAKARADAAEAKASAAAAELARYKVAAEKNVPAELLAGKTEDELRAHADQLLEFRGQQTTRTPSFDGGTRSTAEGGKTDMNALIRRAAGVQPRS